MSLGISGGKQVIKFANKSNGGRVSIKSRAELFKAGGRLPRVQVPNLNSDMKS